MKRYILFFAIVLACISLSSCKKFLEEKQVASLTQDYFNDENGLNALINGLYVYTRVKHEWDANGARLIEAGTDAYMISNAAQARMGAGDYGSDVGLIAGNVNNYLGAANSNNAPMGAYPHINNCNIALEIIDNVKPGKFGTDENFRKVRRAEILMLRSWAYYLISNQLGDVPLLLTPNREDNGIYYYPKASLENIYKQIIADMRYAYENLPPTVLPTERGRATKWAAGHFLAKLYLNRAQAAPFQNSAETHLKMLYKGNVATDLDSVITVASEVIGGTGGALAPDYWTLFNPAVSETNPHSEVLWAAQFDVNTSLNGRFGGNRSVNYHVGNYTDLTGVTRVMAYGRPFGTFKPTDWGYDNFIDKVNDSRYYKTFQYEYIANMPPATSTSFTWSAAAAAWWNANKPANEPAVTAGTKRILSGQRALIYIENQRDEALDSAMVMAMPFQFMVRWIRSAVTGRYYYRLFVDGSPMGLATARNAPYLSSKKYVDPLRGGSSDEANFNSENGTRDAILMRLAETYLLRAEAYGRKGQYVLAVNDINVLRQRAAYKAGENRPNVLAQYEPQAATLSAGERQAPYTAAAGAYNKIMVTEDHFTPGTPQANLEKYIPTATTKADMFIHFIYNEKAREFLSEGITWEDQHNAGILYERTIYHNQMASPLTGRWPVSANTSGSSGQDGNGKGLMQKHYTFRPWPNQYLSQLTDETGKPLDAAGRAAYQNPGY
ncbi:RagB/SusD family nutrient uptake outer membrane protein [Parasegetibacter sp. NRK P23]|uniref:RagB/SusD family nutrient uptake outer membrane protein n=1 Tax=Parasegetibacter sp. NRK P23 TaxID=2942999 RepID=UPI002043212C|nr:RagB/SusD family nutrient uptake outer membrane protein [Parasegetibacter sp. NRK P23]MCM5527298.1 RagB/SusD family nutrient uptake outer membrane protein [Parasegetibacter sp. NRK P23]